MEIKFLTEDTRPVLEGMMPKGVSPEERFEKIVNTSADYLGMGSDYRNRLLEYIFSGYVSLASPVLTNFGTERGLPISCNGSYMSDNMDSIIEKTAEISKMTQNGAGISAYIGALRPMGSLISSGGRTNGPVGHSRQIDTGVDAISQKNRRGAGAVYLDAHHPDIMHFLDIREESHPIQHLTFGVCITDEWMMSMLRGDEHKQDVWARIIERRFESGLPYLFFTDNVNRKAPQWYRDKGMKIHASNLCCVVGDERVVTDRGLLTVRELYEQGGDLTVFDGEKYVPASAMQFVKTDNVYRLRLRNGMTHTVTREHKVSTVRGDVLASDLRIGDKVNLQTKKGLFGPTDMEVEAFILGLYQADGTESNGSILIDIWENNFDIEKEINDYVNELYTKYGFNTYYTDGSASGERVIDTPRLRDVNPGTSSFAKKRLQSRGLKKIPGFEKGVVPEWVWTGTERTQWNYIRGLFTGDGTTNFNSKTEIFNLSIANTNEKFLRDLQIILRNLGISTGLSKMHEEGKSLLPDGKGGYAHYECKTVYRLTCGSRNEGLIFEENTGFLTKKGVTIKPSRKNSLGYSEIVSIEELPEEDTFCLTVYTDEHHWTSNGVVTHNSEIALPSSDNESFVCCLSSTNLSRYDEWKNTTLIEDMTMFLDSVMEEYIRKTANMNFMANAHRFAKNHRAVGLGVLGYHDLLIQRNQAFGDMSSFVLNAEVFKNMDERSMDATKEMAKVYGEAPVTEGYGVRNATRLAVAPTTTSSFAFGGVYPSIEPMFSNYFTKDLEKGSFTHRSPYLKKILEAHGKDNEQTWNSVLVKGGSVQHLDFLTDHERNVLKTFSEINQRDIINQAISRQTYIDQAQSVNLSIHPDTDPEEVSDLYIDAWKGGLKTLYYQRSANLAQQVALSMSSDCSACEA